MLHLNAPLCAADFDGVGHSRAQLVVSKMTWLDGFGDGCVSFNTRARQVSKHRALGTISKER